MSTLGSPSKEGSALTRPRDTSPGCGVAAGGSRPSRGARSPRNSFEAGRAGRRPLIDPVARTLSRQPPMTLCHPLRCKHTHTRPNRGRGTKRESHQHDVRWGRHTAVLANGETDDPCVTQWGSTRRSGWTQAAPAELLADDRGMCCGQNGECGRDSWSACQARARLPDGALAGDLRGCDGGGLRGRGAPRNHERDDGEAGAELSSRSHRRSIDPSGSGP
jgi:hypothetical protein